MLMTRRAFPALAATAVAVAAENKPTINVVPNGGGYAGWPTVARRRSGELVLAWSGEREAHVCPFGRVLFATSKDEGATWSWPRVIMDSDLDDRDAGIVETAEGTLLATTFTSLAYEGVFKRDAKSWAPERVARWRAVERRLTPEGRKALLGCWMLRSTDGGLSWSTPYRTPVNSPHGPVQVSGGRLLYAGKDLWGTSEIGVAESIDDGVSWKWLARIPLRDGDRVTEYHELHLVETTPGKLIAHIRNANTNSKGETLQSESSDGGATWSAPHSIGVWGLPSHLLRLRDGRIVMSYGYRRQPFGNLARVSRDGGATWSEPITVSADAAGGDVGYPSTVELRDGSLLTVWYEKPADSPLAQLRQARWRVPA